MSSKEKYYGARDLVLCESADGWSLHAPGSTDEQIANGDAPYLLTGSGAPTDDDWENAFDIWLNGGIGAEYAMFGKERKR